MPDLVQVRFLPSGRTVNAGYGSNLLDLLRTCGYTVDASCGGNGTCGKCRVRVSEGGAPAADVIACRTALRADTDVYVGGAGPEDEKNAVRRVVSALDAGAGSGFMAAFDLGSTTLVGYLLDPVTGGSLISVSCQNPQIRYGADVISRISYACAHGTSELTGCVRGALNQLLETMTEAMGLMPEAVERIAIAGNTCMHHLLLGIRPDSLGKAPYRPAVTESVTVDAADLDLDAAPGTKVYLPPNIAGFVGGDTVAGLVSTRLAEEEEWTLLVDIGTNGEMVLGRDHTLTACSAAAGPAFEGAGISCGMRGANGAISHAKWIGAENRWEFETIGPGKPAGLCGSGLLDVTAQLLLSGQMDEDGLLAGGEEIVLASPLQTAGGQTLTLTQRDIRQVQLAKAAIAAGIRLLAKECGITLGDIRRVWLTGAFGNHLSPESACAIGLIPPELAGRITPVENAAGRGARLLAQDPREQEYASRAAGWTRYLELASLPQFQEVFVDEMLFGGMS